MGAFSCLAQATKVFPDSAAYWREGNTSYTGVRVISEYNYYLMLGDTIVEGKNYKNVYLHKYTYNSEWNFSSRRESFTNKYGLSQKVALVRLDSSKLFARFDSSMRPYLVGSSSLLNDTDYLLVDFNWVKGDTAYGATHQANKPNYFLVENTGGKNLGFLSTPLEYIKFKNIGWNNRVQSFLDSNLVVKGMGFNSSIFVLLRDIGIVGVANRYSHGYGGVSFFCADGKLIYLEHRLNIQDSNSICNYPIDLTTVSVGIRETKTKSILNAYPNPTSGNVILSGEINGKVNSIIVSDIIGKEYVVDYNLYDDTIETDLSALTKGIYFIKVETDKTTYLCKIIKQ